MAGCALDGVLTRFDEAASSQVLVHGNCRPELKSDLTHSRGSDSFLLRVELDDGSNALVAYDLPVSSPPQGELLQKGCGHLSRTSLSATRWHASSVQVCHSK